MDISYVFKLIYQFTKLTATLEIHVDKDHGFLILFFLQGAVDHLSISSMLVSQVQYDYDTNHHFQEVLQGSQHF